MSWSIVVLNPHWNVPPSIATKDMLPSIRKDLGYLARNHLKVFQGWDSNRKEIAPETVDWSKLTAERFLYEDRG